ncbi:hypothetical protein E9451_12475 [Salmonella enterica]|nr:hypothetical protein [Salmonella enterica]EBS1146873.1 hypothetical protein [Salmonella enterica subsp. enterica serovar Stanley]
MLKGELWLRCIILVILILRVIFPVPVFSWRPGVMYINRFVPPLSFQPLLFSLFSFDLSVVSAERFLHSHGENRFPEDFDHDDHDVIFCRYSVR